MKIKLFQSTLPVWGATPVSPGETLPGPHFNPRSPCGERLSAKYNVSVVVYISIHAPRVGSDHPGLRHPEHHPISIHAPRVGSDLPQPPPKAPQIRFQSTLPVWGATGRAVKRDFPLVISIHAPRVGSDGGAWGTFLYRRFQSTLPVWGATLPSLRG